MALQTNLWAIIDATETISDGADTVVTDLPNNGPFVFLETGTGSGQDDTIYSAVRTLTASSNETLDLNALVDGVGRTRNFAKVKALLIMASTANTNNVVVGNAASAQFKGPISVATATVTLPPGGVYFIAAPVSGWSSADASFDQLKIANSGAGTSVTYTIQIIGTSV